MSSPHTQAQLRTPKGFEHLLEGLCIEVLRSQPENILEFAVKHFDRLLKVREETGYDGYTPKAQLIADEDVEPEDVAELVEPDEVQPPKEEEQTIGTEDKDDGAQDDAPEAEQKAPTEAVENIEVKDAEGDVPESELETQKEEAKSPVPNPEVDSSDEASPKLSEDSGREAGSQTSLTKDSEGDMPAEEKVTQDVADTNEAEASDPKDTGLD